MREGQSPSAVIERLRRRTDFRAATKGLRASGRAFVVQALRRGEGGPIRVGFTVSRQVGSAVERNRVRRRLREVVRQSAMASAGSLQPGHDYVLLARRAALGAAFADLVQELRVVLSRLHAEEARGTGGGRSGALHEAGSAVAPAAARRNRRGRSPSHGPHRKSAE